MILKALEATAHLLSSGVCMFSCVAHGVSSEVLLSVLSFAASCVACFYFVETISPVDEAQQ